MEFKPGDPVTVSIFVQVRGGLEAADKIAAEARVLYKDQIQVKTSVGYASQEILDAMFWHPEDDY